MVKKTLYCYSFCLVIKNSRRPISPRNHVHPNAAHPKDPVTATGGNYWKKGKLGSTTAIDCSNLRSEVL